MEKVKILSVVGATSKNGKSYFKISLDDGRKGTSFNAKFLELKGHEANIEVVKNGDYLNMDIPKEEKQTKLESPQNIKLEIIRAVMSNPTIPDNERLPNLLNFLFDWVKE
jgi:hypothetical protein